MITDVSELYELDDTAFNRAIAELAADQGRISDYANDLNAAWARLQRMREKGVLYG